MSGKIICLNYLAGTYYVMCFYADVFEFLVKSDILNCQHSLPDLFCVSYAQKAALWHMYGNRCVLQRG